MGPFPAPAVQAPTVAAPLALSRDDVWMSALWLGTWWDTFGGGRELQVLAPEEGQQGCWPLFCERRCGLRRLALVGNRYCRHALADADCIPLLAARLAGARDWDELDFTGLPLAQAESWREQLCAHGLAARCAPPWGQRYIPLARPWAQVEREFQPGLPSDVGKRERALQNRGPLALRIQTTSEGLRALFSACLQIEASGWKGARHSAMLCRPVQCAFYRALALRAAAGGALHLALLYCGQTLIAFAFDLVYGNVVSGVKIGYLDNWRRYAPGMVLQYRLLRYLHGRGIAEYDFGGGAETHKAAWTPHARMLANVRAFHSSLRGRAAELLLRGRKARFGL